ncbi:MAG: adenylate/guanylate cyclase domain-containing protein [Alphaproteobacteria bacterium]
MLNVAAWLGAVVPAIFAIVRFVDPRPDVWTRGIVNALVAIALVCLPMLHRFGPLVAPLVFAAIAYAFIFRNTYQIGTDGGSHLSYLLAGTLSILILGFERLWLGLLVSAIAVAMIAALHFVTPANTGLLSAEALRLNFVINAVVTAIVLTAVVYYAVREIARAEAAAEREFRRSDALLANILPPSVAERLKERPGAEIADRYPDASILFADMAGFTARASDTDPAELLRFLNGVFTRLDALVEGHGLEKIKTTGDAYMVVGGVPLQRPDHAEAMAALALDMRDALTGLVDPKGRAVPVRIGMASGPVVAGVVGTRKFFYDVWGDAVNTAARMEQTGEAGKIQVAPNTRERLEERFVLRERGSIEVRGKGAMRTWFLEARKPAAAAPNRE